MFQIKLDDLSGVEIFQLLQQHLEDMQATSPPESNYTRYHSRCKVQQVVR